jgi:hypothetical protein
MLETTLKLQDGNYNIFPVFKRYNTARDLVETVTPDAANGEAWFQSYSFGEGVSSAIMNLKDLLQSVTFTSGAAWVVVNNQTTSGGIQFLEGTVVYKTATGLENIMTSRTFQIDMPRAGEKQYADSVVKGGWKFGPPSREVTLQTSQTDPTPVDSITIRRDKMYTVTVTGDANSAGGIKAWISLVSDIPTNEFGEW